MIDIIESFLNLEKTILKNNSFGNSSFLKTCDGSSIKISDFSILAPFFEENYFMIISNGNFFYFENMSIVK